MILDEIAAKTKDRVAALKEQIPLEVVMHQAQSMNPNTGFPFEKALQAKGMSFICEVKKASPSKGMIVEDFPYMQIAKDYEEAGAAAISCLTEPYYFQGSDAYLRDIAQVVKIPVLRKDFTVDPYMIYEAKILGASAILLICGILTDEELEEYLEIAHSLGLSALIEAHTQEEVLRAVACGGHIIGVNNRDLQTFQVDVNTSVRLRHLVPAEYLYVSESGITTPKDIQILRDNGTNGVLIGETLMRAPDKKAMLEELSGGR